MKKGTTVLGCAAGLLLAIALTAVAAFAASGGSSTTAAAAKATAGFRDVAGAKAAGFALLKDKHGIACIAMDMPGMTGAMGVHYVKASRVGDGTIKATEPEALVYAPVGKGGLQLAAVEYVVTQEAWLAHHTTRPVLFGHRFNFTPAGNRFGLPAYYSLHAWIWQVNPDGQFAMWNPRVSCAGKGGGYR